MDVMMLTQLLNQMDGLTPCENIIVIGNKSIGDSDPHSCPG
jgi:ATP-dependent 26S proteasome regulatory subunit